MKILNIFISYLYPQVKKDILWSDALINTFSSNYLASQNMILWQYFCSENGVLRLYPATSPYKKVIRSELNRFTI